jgi:hypothetical protein
MNIRFIKFVAPLVIILLGILILTNSKSVFASPNYGNMWLGYWDHGIQNNDFSGPNSFTIPPAVVFFYGCFFGDINNTCGFPTTYAQTAYNDGYTLFIKFAPDVGIDQVVSGSQYTAGLQHFADGLSAFGHPVDITYASEMNGNWTTNYDYTHYTAAQWKTSWKYVVSTINNRLSADGATGIADWVFAPNVNCGSPTCTDWANYWPGSANSKPGHGYVNILGFDGYNDNPGTATFSSIYSASLAEISNTTGANTIPLIVSETGVKASANQASAIGPWITGACNAGVVMLDYFNASSSASGRDYTLSTSSEANMASAWAALPTGCANNYHY